MAYSDYSSPFGFRLTPWVKRLLIANAAVFIATFIATRAGFPLLNLLALVPAEVLRRPWTPISYMFAHLGIWHILFNMIALFFFGPMLEERWGGREFIKFYLIAGLGGAVASFLFPYQPIIGASAAIYGLLVAFALYWPESPIYFFGIFPIKAKWLVAGLIGMNIFFALTGGQGGVAHLAHLGGALVGFVYLKSPLAPSPFGDTYGSRRRARQWSLSGLTSLFHRRRRPAARPDTARTIELKKRLDDVDQILDKISAGGMASLTKEERQRLEEASRQFRSN
ncbi:MAG TPA: rhomboid family intramembrane serine protease [Longimicrobiaceae bacterium]|nr:rhomboid family intramembrane serine protease [Longimicrobiaceae bacterium]